ncbi:hypothetical protein L665_00198 [Ralstonia solanacearum SD54]|nr:hypothetical protein L665_00198 [Ralstonia solanacearum SD54]
MGGRAARAAGLIGTGCGDFPGRRQPFPGGREPRDARLGQRGCRGSGAWASPARNADWIGLRRPTGSGCGAGVACPEVCTSGDAPMPAGFCGPGVEVMRPIGLAFLDVDRSLGMLPMALPESGCLRGLPVLD